MNPYSISEIREYLASIYADAPLLILPYAYPVVFGSSVLTQNTVSTQQVSITANADFVLLGLRHRADISGAQTEATKTAPFVRVLITDSGSNEQFTSAQVDLENYSSNGTAYRRLPYPRLLQGRTSLTVQVTNFAPTAETYRILEILLEGVLVRKYTR